MQLLSVGYDGENFIHHYENGDQTIHPRRKPRVKPAAARAPVSRSSSPRMSSPVFNSELEESWELEQARRAKAAYKASRAHAVDQGPQIDQGGSQADPDTEWLRSMLSLAGDHEAIAQLENDMGSSKAKAVIRPAQREPSHAPESEVDDDSWVEEMVNLAGG